MSKIKKIRIKTPENDITSDINLNKEINLDLADVEAKEVTTEETKYEEIKINNNFIADGILSNSDDRVYVSNGETGDWKTLSVTTTRSGSTTSLFALNTFVISAYETISDGIYLLSFTIDQGTYLNETNSCFLVTTNNASSANDTYGIFFITEGHHTPGTTATTGRGVLIGTIADAIVGSTLQFVRINTAGADPFSIITGVTNTIAFNGTPTTSAEEVVTTEEGTSTAETEDTTEAKE